MLKDPLETILYVRPKTILLIKKEINYVQDSKDSPARFVFTFMNRTRPEYEPLWFYKIFKAPSNLH